MNMMKTAFVPNVEQDYSEIFDFVRTVVTENSFMTMVPNKGIRYLAKKQASTAKRL